MDQTNGNSNKRKIDLINDELCKRVLFTGIQEKAVIYARVSTKNQTFGTSLDSQILLCQSYCQEKNFDVIKTVSEVASAKKMDHQQELVDIVSENENINLIVSDPSRLSRNVSDFVIYNEYCKSKNITIHFVQDTLTTNNNMDFKMILSHICDAQTESINLGMRVKRSILHRKRNKTYRPTTTKYGVKVNKTTKILERDDKEELIVDLINKLYYGAPFSILENIIFNITGNKEELDFADGNQMVVKGNLLYIDIARLLNSLDIKRRGKLWSSRSISNVIVKN